jgi:probable HAF family extracellular repeat protein
MRKRMHCSGMFIGFATNSSTWVRLAAPPVQISRAFFWKHGVTTDLGTVKGDGCSVAYHINARGQVVGTSGDHCNEVHGFMWERGGPLMVACGVFPDGDHHTILLLPCEDECESFPDASSHLAAIANPPLGLGPDTNPDRSQMSARLRARLTGRYSRLRNIAADHKVMSGASTKATLPSEVRPKNYDRWLRPGDPERPPVHLRRPFPGGRMTAWKVDRKVGNLRNDTPHCVEPMADPENDRPGLFS